MFYFCNLFHFCISNLRSYIFNKMVKMHQSKGKKLNTMKMVENELLHFYIKTQGRFLFSLKEKLRQCTAERYLSHKK